MSTIRICRRSGAMSWAGHVEMLDRPHAHSHGAGGMANAAGSATRLPCQLALAPTLLLPQLPHTPAKLERQPSRLVYIRSAAGCGWYGTSL